MEWHRVRPPFGSMAYGRAGIEGGSFIRIGDDYICTVQPGEEVLSACGGFDLDRRLTRATSEGRVMFEIHGLTFYQPALWAAQPTYGIVDHINTSQEK